MTFQLICEGRCNPHLHVADTLQHQFATARQHQIAFDSTDRMIAAQRKLHHTQHLEIDVRTAKCCECGCVRKYGN